MTESVAIPELLVKQARAGDGRALGRLLELYRNYLRVVARAMIGQALRVRLDASDLVQETFLKAHREFGHFLCADRARAGLLAPADYDPDSGQPGPASPP